MKKRILLGASAIIVALVAIIFGPELLDLYRLQRYIGASAEAYRSDKGPWPHPTDTCIGCHGVNGNSQNQAYPSLAGQPAPYLADQLHKFAGGQRANPNMGPLAMTMSESEIKLLADHFAKQPVGENRSFEPDPGLREKGRQLVEKGACAACHGARLMGHDQFPRLAGQGYDYLLAQFGAFAVGTRSESTGMMKNIAIAASPEDRKAIATYLASLAPENK
ncbi:cytochrome C signal peptide protein [Pandoraea terrae]|uniref:Cytochrome C signal peptide protein n=1 Tax=Pandoraea terrae TaxID=1537710 RepID=A0A5E4VJR5_9BURK|nr:c-type cytochrome [Pandoraea terrae]VVE12557.1 cytochrome C signal peptide protein [Pandoraea terrae]